MFIEIFDIFFFIVSVGFLVISNLILYLHWIKYDRHRDLGNQNLSSVSVIWKNYDFWKYCFIKDYRDERKVRILKKCVKIGVILTIIAIVLKELIKYFDIK